MNATEYKHLCQHNDSEHVARGRGHNIIPPPKPRPLWLGFLDKFRDPLIIVLLVVFVFSVAVALYEIRFDGKGWSTLIEPAGVLMALLLATGVGFLFEVRAEREFRVLNRKKDERPVKVLRWPSADSAGEPQMQMVPRSDVVVGDVVRLESGDEVPADGTLVRADTLLIDESAFTGETYATKSMTPASADEEEAYPRDFLLRGSIVLEGQCLYHVSAVGLDTEEGRGAMLVRQESNVKTPLNRQLDDLGLWITRASYIVAALIVAGRLAYFFLLDGNSGNNSNWLEIVSFTLDSVMIAVTLIVVAVPEGLPMSVTISLAMSMRRMLKENNLVRRLHACETMGAATVICTDKTGTLTRNQLRVMPDSQLLLTDADTLARCIAINSTAELTQEATGTWRTIGNPTEGALLQWLRSDKGIDYRTLRNAMTVVKQEPFSSDTKRMTTVARDNATGRMYRYVKGAPEIVLDMADDVAGAMNADDISTRLAEMQRRGRRTLAFAVQELPSHEAAPTAGATAAQPAAPLTFIGVVGMADPVRDDVPAAVDVCHKAGVNIIMVTGDVALTATEVARQTGILPPADNASTPPCTATAEPIIMNGRDFEHTTDDELRTHVLTSLKVLARARPADKARLVGLLQDMGHVVAVTGDGTNDAPALKRAQVGLSMGDGTSRAKEASDITIIDNSFASINTAILWGRSLYRNIQRFILFQMTINVCACLIVLCGAFMGLDSPLNVTQMLWVNLIMDTFAAMALSSLPPDRRVMLEAPRKTDSHIIERRMATNIIAVGLLLFALLFGLWQLLWHHNITSVADMLTADFWQTYFSGFMDFTRSKQHLSRYELAVFFSVFVMLQFWNLFNARYYHTGRSLVRDMMSPAAERAPLSRGFTTIALIIVVGQVVIVNVFGEMFGVVPLSATDWLLLALVTSPVLLVGEAMRALDSN